jgi:hypothetical protein
MMKKSCLLHLSILAIVIVMTFEASASGSDRSMNCATLQQTESRNSLKIDPPTKAIQVSQRNLRKANRLTTTKASC